MQWAVRTAALAMVALLLPACSPTGGAFKGYWQPPLQNVSGQLQGSQVVPASGSAATGTATLGVDPMRTFIDYTINATGIGSPVSAIEVRLGDPGINGAVLFSIPVAAFPVSGRLTAADLLLVSPTMSFANAGDSVAAGGTYLLIRSGALPDGELRGHLGPTSLASVKVSGAQESTPVGGTGTGSAVLSLNATQDQFTVSLSVTGVAGITGAQIFDGKPGVDGSAPLFVITAAPFTVSASATLDSGNFSPSATVASFPAAVNALLSGGLYVQVLTGAHPSGEIRGQIGPTQLNATLTPADVVPPVVSAAAGAGFISFGAMQDEVLIHLTHTVVTPNAVEIHAQLPTKNGPLLFNVGPFAGASTSPVDAILPSKALIPAPGEAIATFADAVDAMLTGRTYVLVCSPGFPAGEIRGQFLP